MKKALPYLFVAVLLSGFLLFNELLLNNYVPRSNAENVLEIRGAAAYMRSLRANQITGIVDHADVLKAQKQSRLLSTTKSGVLHLTWAEQGPDNVGGRTRALLIDQSNHQHIYAGGVSGGLWKSTTGGSSWQQVKGFDDNLVISCMAQDKDGYIFVGTGEGFYDRGGRGHGGFLGNGVYKSAPGTDLFAALTSTAPTLENSNQAAWAFVNELACDPVSGRLYAATNKGLLYSDDKGVSWVNPVLYPVHEFYGFAADVEVASDQTVTVVIDDILFVSPDGAAGSFEIKSSGLPHPADVSRIEVAVAPTDPNYLYACAAANDYSLYGIYRSKDKGETWSLIGPGGSDDFQPLAFQGEFDNEIVVFPDNKNKILVGGLDLWLWEEGKTWEQKSIWYAEPKSVYYVHADHHKYVFHPTNPMKVYLGTDGGVFMSSNGGNTFSTLNKQYNVTQFYSLAYTSSGRLFGGTQDNGVQYVYGGGNSAMEARRLRNGDGGYAEASMLDTDAFFVSVYYGDVLRTADAGLSYQGGDAQGDAIDYSKFFSEEMINGVGEAGYASFVTPLKLWESAYDAQSKDSLVFAAQRSYQAGDTIQVTSGTANWQFNHILTQDLADGEQVKLQDVVQSRFFLGVTDAVWMTREALDFSKTPEWFKVAKVSGQVSTMAVSQDGRYLWVGAGNKLYRVSDLSDGYDYKTADSRSSVCALKVKLVKSFSVGRIIISIAVNPHDADEVLVTLANYGNTDYIYYSSNATADTVVLASRQGDLPAMPVYSALFLLDRPDTVLIGTDNGLFSTTSISSDSPAWSKEEGGPGNCPVFMIRQQTAFIPGAVRNYGEIYLATHGRGLFKSADFYNSINENKKGVASDLAIKVFPNPASYRTLCTVELDHPQQVQLALYTISGACVYQQSCELGKGLHELPIQLRDWRAGTYIVAIRTATGVFTNRLLVTR